MLHNSALARAAVAAVVLLLGVSACADPPRPRRRPRVRRSSSPASTAWPVGPELTYPLPDHVAGLPKTLTISITGDTTTPYRSGVVLADAFGGSLLAVDGDQHPIAATGASPCVDDTVADYLMSLRTPPAGTRCHL